MMKRFHKRLINNAPNNFGTTKCLFVKKLFLFIPIVLFSTNHLFAQEFFTTFFLGGANYKGDLGNLPFIYANSKPAFGVGINYELNSRMILRADFMNGKVTGADALGGKNVARNLSFRSNISEFSIGFEYILFDLYQYKVSPYVFVGVGKFRFNPFTRDKNGLSQNLYELNTEGQGFFEDRKPYKLTETAIPLGGGLQWAISDNARIAVEVGVRYTTTDYIDDVSKTYADPVLLGQFSGGNAVRYAYRGGELKDGVQAYPATGSPRGNPGANDLYFFSGIRYKVRLVPPRVSSKQLNKSRARKTSCPHKY